MWEVLRTNGFVAFIMMAFLNACVALGHTILIQSLLLRVYDGKEQLIFTAIINALILLPVIGLFTPAGFVADKYPKVRIMRYSAWATVGSALLITLSYYLGWFWLSIVGSVLLALQSAFYLPAQLGYIREILGDGRLVQGNALLQSAIALAVLVSTFFFSLLFELRIAGSAATQSTTILQQIAPLGWILVVLSLIETRSAYLLPPTRPTDPDLQFNSKDYLSGKLGYETLKLVRRNHLIWLTIIGLSVFWAVSQIIAETYPSYAKAYLGIHSAAFAPSIMALAGVGLIVGSLWAGRLSRQFIEMGLIPVGAIGIMINVALITWISSPTLQALNFFVLGIMSGLFITPLNALMQYYAPAQYIGRILASYHLINNVIMLVFLVITMILVYIGLQSLNILYLLTVVTVLGALYTVHQMPQSLLRFIISRLFNARYRLQVLGFENLPSSGGVLLLGNHISWIDWALVQMASPRPVRFVMEKGYYERWYLKGVLNLFRVIPIQGGASSEKALADIHKLLNQGEVICLFPEGAISRTGHLGEFKRGYEKGIEGTNAVIVPFYLHGLWGSRFSRSSGFLRQVRQSGFKRDIIVAYGEPMPATTRAPEVKQKVFDLSFASWQAYSHLIDPIPVSWLHSAKRLGFRMAATDVLGEPLGQNRFITAVFSFARAIKKGNPEQNVGFLLPTSMGGAIANMAALSLAKTVVNLNYTASADAMRSAVEQAQLQRIYTSRLFIQRLLEQRSIDIKAILPTTPLVFLEDVKAAMPQYQLMLTMLVVTVLPASLLKLFFLRYTALDSTAAILFSSGSEGEPKGVELTHRNLAINARQVADMLNTREDDVMMGTLPTFHAFGLLASTLMPLSEGIPLVYHPDPTDAVNIAKGVAKYEATVLFGTATFLRIYARNQRVHPLMFKSLRYVVAGAEKLSPEIRQLFNQRFNKTILEWLWHNGNLTSGQRQCTRSIRLHHLENPTGQS